MRPSTDASLPPWPTRILRPWLVASAAGLSIGTFLLSFSSASPPDDSSYTETSPRAAMHGPGAPASFIPDPFAPAASLAAPPEAPFATSPEMTDALPISTSPARAADAP